MNNVLWKFIVMPLLSPFFKTSVEGAQTQIRLACDPDLDTVTGKYFADCKEANISKQAKSDENAEWLYKKSIELVGL
jgi:hypothetical protein